MKSKRLTLALPKGRLLTDAWKILVKAGVLDGVPPADDDRRLVIPGKRAGDPGVLLVKPQDVAVYVAQGAADIGIVGNDVLREHELPVYEPLDLHIGRCRLSLAGSKEFSARFKRRADKSCEDFNGMRIATKYPRLTAAWAERQGLDVSLICLHGSVELAPLVSVADAIVDLVSTGRTLRENGLREIATVLNVSARLIVNRAALKTSHTLAPLLRDFQKAVR